MLLGNINLTVPSEKKVSFQKVVASDNACNYIEGFDPLSVYFDNLPKDVKIEYAICPIAYVAITRAKMQLVIISSDKKSPFIREFDKNTYELIADGGKPKEPDVPPDYSLTVEVGDTIISKLISNGTKHKIWIWPELYSHHNSIIGLHIDDKFKLDFKEYRIIEIIKKRF